MAAKRARTMLGIGEWFGIRSRRTACTRPPRSDVGRVSRYLTDGVNLYRFVGWVDDSVDSMVALEDCRSLDVVLVSSAELTAGTLRAVSVPLER